MIALVCHDAGGAEILSSYARQTGLDYLYVLEGPACKVFERKLGPIKTTPLDEAVRRSASILCGTSWQSDIEINAIKLARSLGKHSVAFIDHWVNYRERFTRSGATFLPDEIWVGDRMAETMAKEVFPGLPVTWVDNPYLLDIRQELAAIEARNLPAQDSLSVLYICEPIGEHALLRHGDAYFWGYVEEDALRYFLTNCAALGKPIRRVLIRPHPSERAGKYSWAQDEFGLPIEMGGEHTLLEEVIDSDVVVGCGSMAMVVALLIGKKVVSCIPPGGKSFSLPHADIISLQAIIKNDEF
ncbi:MAG: hypothetical protein Q7U38_07400 [Methylobacter sp.]|nr:hypothetical protein [Methylobacter sp.]MDP2097061.1 hypothetical protein [Methylobacter sp.]MDP2427999.1 hypothetical protein [Methylobacter sp.]MDP3055895.1 hypothetical protein [Methylobacter sp.]MDP3363053.1 hypothetical protein [Methylobacter sp.]